MLCPVVLLLMEAVGVDIVNSIIGASVKTSNPFQAWSDV